MKLTDQEQVILRAIDHVGRNGLAEIAKVVKAVGYPKATTKKILLRLSEKGAVNLHRHDWPASLKPEQRKLLVRIGSNYYGAVSVRKRNPIRFEVGRRLSKAEKDEVLKSLGDSYKDFHAPKVLKRYDRISGDPIYGYEYNPDYMYRSDITGRLIRHYVVLPDGRKAHPTEIFPNVTKSEIDKYAMEREAAESLRRERDQSREWRIADNKQDANEKYKRTNRKIPGSYFARDDAGRIVRVDAKDADDVSYYKTHGFKQITPIVNMSNPKTKTGKGKAAARRAGKALKGLARGALQSGAEILGAGAMALNPSGKVRFIKGEYKGMTGVIESIIQKRYTKEPTTYRIQIDGFGRKFGKPGGWNGQVTATEDQIESIKSNPLIQPGRHYKMKPDYEPTAIIEAGMRGGFKAVFIAKDGLAGQVGGFKTRQEATTWAKAQGFKVIQKTKKPNKTIIKAKRIDHLDVSKVHNPRKRNTATKKPSKAKRLAKLAVKGLAKKNPFSPMGFEYRKGHEFGSSPLRGQKAAKLRLRLNRLTERWEKAKTPAQLAKIKKEMDATWAQLQATGVTNPRNRKAKRNASRTVSAVKTAKRRAGASSKNSRKKAASKVRSVASTRKASTRRIAGRAIKKSSGLLKKGKRRNSARLSAAQWASEMARLRDIKPRPLAKLYGKQGPTPEQMSIHVAQMREWNKLYRHASKMQKLALEEDNAAFRARQAQNRAKKKTRNPSAESIRKEFAGQVNGERDLFFPQGTPAGKLAKLGKLVSITTEAGTIKPVHGAAWLCADTKGKLHIGSVSGAPLFDGPARSFGHVTKLEYESSKPHLGYGPTIWFHKAGEENGIRPTLRADGKGGLVFKGGDYRLTRRGIEN